jgi:hypothetical protein
MHYKVGISLFVGAMTGAVIFGIFNKKIPK